MATVVDTPMDEVDLMRKAMRRKQASEVLDTAAKSVVAQMASDPEVRAAVTRLIENKQKPELRTA